MRIIRTFILRVLVDTESPLLRGTVRAVEEDVEWPFVGEEALLTLVREMVRSCPGEGDPTGGAANGEREA